MGDPQIHAANRFGLGRSSLDPVVTDPRKWLLEQLEHPDVPPDTVGTAQVFQQLEEDAADRMIGLPGARRGKLLQVQGTRDWLLRSVTTSTPFHERLVTFWANHLTVAAGKGQVGMLAPSFVQEAIRPHVLGRFQDMLLAAMRHPAMLLYLDNAQSVGPTSRVGSRKGGGLNENLARECMELHTVSPASGYGQEDVTQLAMLLTGWGIERRQEPRGFRFREQAHEPGGRKLMGHQFPPGEEGGIQALAFLANHPATSRHLATRLATHFVSDVPPRGVVARLEAVLHDTGNDLGRVARELVMLPEAWAPMTKLRTPRELVVAACRATQDQGADMAAMLVSLGQPTFGAPLPNGWPDVAAGWLGPEAMVRRVDWAYAMSGRPGLPEPREVAMVALGSSMSAATSDAIAAAGSRRESLALLLASPEFQRR